MENVKVSEGFEVTIAELLEKVTLCQFYANKYSGALRSTANTQLQEMLDSALPELYAAIIVFVVKARNYFETKGEYTLYL